MQRCTVRLVPALVLLGASAAAILLGGCAPRALAYGVLLWGAGSAPAEGTVLPVVARSSIDATVTLWLRASRSRVTMEAWRVREFPHENEAQVFAAAFAAYRDTFAFTDRSAGLPVREKADTEAGRVYKIAPGQLLKVLGRSAAKSKEGIFEDYWYEVLTDDGYSGYCFGYFLRTFGSTREAARERMGQILAEDPVLDKLLSDVWRPEYFADMVKTGRYDLAKFSSEIGLFPDRQASEWKLALPGFTATYHFERPENPGSGVYTFPPTDLRIVVYPGDRLEVSYTREGKVARTVFVTIKDDVEGLITAERERRQELLDGFLGQGALLESNAYGSIRLEEDGTFAWSGFGRVASGVFLRTVSGGGKLDFPCRLAPELQGTYTGAVSFVFDEYKTGEQTVFAYSFGSGGVQLTRVAPADVEDLEVKRLSASPLVMYFTFRDR